MLQKNSPGGEPSKAAALEPLITEALRKVGRETLIRHKREGFPIVSWRDGKVELIAPEDIVIPPEDEPSPS